MRLRALLGVVIGLAAAAAAPAQRPVPTRAEIPAQYTWDLAAMYADGAAWEADFAAAQAAVRDLAGRKDAPLEDPVALAALLTLRDDTRWRVDKLVVYASQLSDQDTRDNAALALKNRAVTLQVGYGQAAAWIEPRLLTLPAERLREWVTREPALRGYAHYVNNVLRQAPHTLSAREEELLALAGNLAASPEDTFNVLRSAELPWPTIRDETGEEVRLSPARYDRFIRSADRRVRREAFRGAMAAAAAFQNTFAGTFNGAVQRNLYFARARGFDSALEAVLFPDNVPLAVYRNLVETTGRHLPLLHRWAALRKRVCGYDELHVYDLYQPLVVGGAAEVPYDEAAARITAAVAPLGPEYQETLRRGLASRWVDVYETQGKRPGGYSWGSYDTPPYILINYNGTPRDVSVLAHELGHSLHSHFTHRSQPKVYGEYSSFVAEVPSILNELLLEDWQLAQADAPQARLVRLNEMIDNLVGTLFRQVAFAEFEYEAHALAQRGEALTAERLGRLYQEIFQRHWGPALTPDPENAVYWARIPHFYMNHYVFRYATSYCAATAIGAGILEKRPGAVDAYLGLLKAGSSDDPLVLLKNAGVDLTTPAPIEATMRRFARLLDEFEQLLPAAGPRP